jgi:hypothetical protein
MTHDSLRWFSGMCKRLCIIEGVGAVTEEQSVWVFRASDRRTAVQRFLALARGQDQDVRNTAGQRVRWVVTSLETVDELEEGKLGDREVYSHMTEIEPPDTSIDINAELTPDAPEPGLSGV